MQTGRSQLRRYKAKKSLVSEGEASEPSKPKSQIVEFWLVREYCDKGSLMVRSLHPHSYLPHSYVPTFMHTLSHSSMPSLTFICSCIQSFTHAFIQSISQSTIHAPICSFFHPRTRSQDDVLAGYLTTAAITSVVLLVLTAGGATSSAINYG